MQGMAESSNSRYEVSSGRRSKIRNHRVELQCSLGRVLDISATGMRVSCRRVPKEKWIKILLNTTVDPLPVRARVAWTKRMGFRKHEVGLHFVEPSPEIVKLVRSCSTLDDKVCWDSQ